MLDYGYDGVLLKLGKQWVLTRIQFDDYAVILAWVCRFASLRGYRSVDAGAVLCSGPKPRSNHRSVMAVSIYLVFANLELTATHDGMGSHIETLRASELSNVFKELYAFELTFELAMIAVKFSM